MSKSYLGRYARPAENNRKENMKVCKEYDVLDGVENKQSGKTLYAFKATGNYQIYEDDGELIDTTDEAHLQANIRHYMECDRKEL